MRIFPQKKAFWVAAFLLAALAGVVVLFFSDPWISRKRTKIETTNIGCSLGAFPPRAETRAVLTLAHVYLDWDDNFAVSVPELAGVSDAPVLVTWEPYEKTDPNRSLLPDIANGNFDSTILASAKQIATLERLVLLRWGHEMNGNWYSWSGFKNQQNPSLYISAYRRIHKLFASAGNKNVKWIFGVNGEDVPNESWNKFERYYPGDEFVDAVAVDVYNWGDSPKNRLMNFFRWKNPKQLLTKPYERIVRSMSNKPIIIAEIGTSSSGGDKSEWIENLFESLPTRFPAVKALFWFDVNKETDWAVSTNSQTWSVFQRASHNPHIQNSVDFLEKTLIKDSP